MTTRLSDDTSQLMRGSARGSVVLMVGQVLTAIISAVTFIWVARVLGSTDYGLYTVAFIPVSIALLFQDLGMNSSLTRFCAKYRHEEQYDKLKSVVMTGLIFSIVSSLVISTLMFIFAEPIATIFLKRPETEMLVKASSLTVLGSGGLVTTIQAIFVGYEIMNIRSTLQIFWSLLRATFTFILIWWGYGVFGAVLANTISQIVTGLVGLLLLFVFIKFKIGDEGHFSWEMLKTFLSFGLPLSISTLLNGILAQIYNYIMILYVATDLIGNYGAANNFAVLVSFITVPIATNLFPLYSKFKKNDPKLKTVFQLSVKYTTIVTLPVVFVIIALASPLSRILYGINDYPYVPLYLSIFILNYAWEGLGGISLNNLISGIGESRITLNSSILTVITGMCLGLILVPRYQMLGILITIVLDARGGWIYQTYWVKKELDINVDWRSTIKIYGIALVSFVITYLVVNGLYLQGFAALILGGGTYFIVYLLGLPFMGALTTNDFKQLIKVVEVLGPLAPLAKWILSLMVRLVKYRIIY